MVKGLGGFVCQRQSAQIKDSYFIPPTKILTFNQSLDKGDGLLANHIAKEEKVSYQIAQQKIQSFSQKIMDTLEDEKEIYLKNLGSFKKNNENKLIFEPDSKSDWLVEAYGFSKIKVSEIPKPKLQPIPIRIEHKIEDKTEELKSSKTSYWKYAAIGLIAIGLAGFIGSQVYQNDVEQHNLAEQKKAEQIIDKKIQESSFVFSEPLKPISVEVNAKIENSGKYHIVGGAFRIKANAEKKIKQLRQKGFEARYIGANAYGLHQVVYESFTERRKAINKLNEIKSTENPSAWLYIKEL
jgi:nucleoid DNA-binding protein